MEALKNEIVSLTEQNEMLTVERDKLYEEVTMGRAYIEDLEARLDIVSDKLKDVENQLPVYCALGKTGCPDCKSPNIKLTKW